MISSGTDPRASPEPSSPEDFAEFMWMEDQETFEKEYLRQLEEEALIQECLECMMEDENMEADLADISEISHPSNFEEIVKNSKLNPEAPEFVSKIYLVDNSPQENESEGLLQEDN